MMRFRRELAAAWLNGRSVVVAVFIVGAIAGSALAWIAGMTPRVGRYQFHVQGLVTTRTDTMTGEVMVFSMSNGEAFSLDMTKTAKTK